MRRRYCPYLNEPFLLTLGQPVEGLELVKVSNCDQLIASYPEYDPAKWQFIGTRVEAQTKRFKLIQVDYFDQEPGVNEQIITQGHVPAQGQWGKPFLEKFAALCSDRHWHHVTISLADPSWKYPDGRVGYPKLVADISPLILGRWYMDWEWEGTRGDRDFDISQHSWLVEA